MKKAEMRNITSSTEVRGLS